MQYGDFYDSVSFKNLPKYEALKTHRDSGVSLILATRGRLPIEVVRSWDRIRWPMNQKRCNFDVRGKEVADAYNELVTHSLNNPVCKDWPLIWSMEEDNIISEMAFHKLFAALYTCIDCGKDIDKVEPRCVDGHKSLDAVSGLYFTKTIPPYPMAYGDPKDPDFNFRTVSVEDHVENERVFEVNGIAMGCTLFRKDIFKRVSFPWFRTLNGTEGVGMWSQDLFFSKKAKEEAGARFAVHAGVKVGHIDMATGVIY